MEISKAIAAVKEWVSQHREEIENTYEQLHGLAEVSWQEQKTTEYLSTALQKMGLACQTFTDQTGVVAVWQGGQPGPVVGLRADIDALYQYVDGNWQANHSCGHDAHMTMVLQAVRCLQACGFTPAGTLKVIFQPAEETGLGAKSLIAKGVADDLQKLLGIHVRPLLEMPIGTASPAIYHGATTHLQVKVKGVQAHAARPNQGVNVIDSMAAIVAAVNAVKADPTVPASAKVTKMTAGDSLNIIPDYGELGIDLRAQTNEVMDTLVKQVTQAVRAAGSANGAQIEIAELARLGAAVPHPGMEQVVSRAIVAVLGEQALISPPVTPGGEDFHFYPIQRPNIAATMIGLGAGVQPGLHHPQMSFERETLQHGVAILAVATMLLFWEQ